MGLDITKYRVTMGGEPYQMSRDQEHERVMLERFPHLITTETIEMVDAQATFTKFADTDAQYDSYNISDDCFEFVYGDSTVKVKWEDVVRVNEIGECLPVSETGYQRKGMTDEFYQTVLRSGVSGVHDNDVLDEIKKMAVSSDCNLNRWKLDDDEFVDFCW